MTGYSQLVEQHIREYESRLQHIDELLERADTETSGETSKELTDLKQERDKLASFLTDAKQQSREDLREEELQTKLGPMIIWQTVAEKLEHIVERVGR
jgi:uncharacterized protein Yka (UPF0111/DUF47 family)